MADIFISYKREDKHLAEDVISRLTEAGLTVWYDERIAPHTSWDETIEREIAAAKAVVVLWTPRSVISEWVRTEADYAKEHGKLVPVMLEACSLPLAYRRTQTADLTHWEGDVSDRNWLKLLGWVTDLTTGKGKAPGGIGPATASDFGYSQPAKKKSGWLIPLASLVVLAGAGLAALDVMDIIDISELLGEEEAENDNDNVEVAEIAPSPSPTLPPKPTPTGPPPPPSCIAVEVKAPKKDPNGLPWDFPSPPPDITVTSGTHGGVRFACDNSYSCSGSGYANVGAQRRINLRIMDDDIDKDDTMGSGSCAIPSTKCRVGAVTVNVRAC